MKSIIPVYDIQNFTTYKDDGIFVSRFEPYAKQHLHLHSAHRHNFYHLVFFTEGQGQHQIDFKNFEVKPQLIYFMVPGQVHSWSFNGTPQGYIINFSADYFNNLLLKHEYLNKFSFFNGRVEEQVLNLTTAISNKVIATFEDILKEGDSETPLHDDLVRILLLQLFIEVERSTASQSLNPEKAINHTLLNKFKHLVAENYVTLRLPKQYATLLFITPNHLNALCKDFLGTSAGKLIRDRVMLEAKRLLTHLDFRVADIAEKLNFEDNSYFVKFFKKYEGITPDKFRKQYLITSYGNA